jgi:hypothetical protein
VCLGISYCVSANSPLSYQSPKRTMKPQPLRRKHALPPTNKRSSKMTPSQRTMNARGSSKRKSPGISKISTMKIQCAFLQILSLGNTQRWHTTNTSKLSMVFWPRWLRVSGGRQEHVGACLVTCANFWAL